MKPSAKHVSVQDAARLAGVTPETIRAWVSTGLLPARREKVVKVVYRYAVLRSALDGVKRVSCKYCGKAFTARRPRKALFCSAKHRDRWRYEQKTRKQRA